MVFVAYASPLININLNETKSMRQTFEHNFNGISSFFRFFFFLVYYLCACRSLGLAKIKTPPGHHRKRLAVESSRHHSRPDDSHMFIIKLPPNPYYYANSKTAQNKNGIEDKNQKVRTNLPKCKLQQVSVSSKFALSQRFWRESAEQIEWINEREWNFLEYSTSDFWALNTHWNKNSEIEQKKFPYRVKCISGCSSARCTCTRPMHEREECKRPLNIFMNLLCMKRWYVMLLLLRMHN